MGNLYTSIKYSILDLSSTQKPLRIFFLGGFITACLLTPQYIQCENKRLSTGTMTNILTTEPCQHQSCRLPHSTPTCPIKSSSSKERVRDGNAESIDALLHSARLLLCDLRQIDHVCYCFPESSTFSLYFGCTNSRS